MNETVAPRRLTAEVLMALTAVEQELESTLEPLGLSLAKLRVLVRLAEAGGPITLGQLAESCSCVRSNITQLIDRLEAEKLVVRSDDPRDRRSVRAELTASGRARHDAGLAALDVAEEKIVGRVPEPLRPALVPVLRALQGEK